MNRFILTIIHKFNWIFYLILIPVLLYSVVRSGYFYLYNIDELSHIQGVWLINHGYKPYASFFFTFTPFFYWFLTPLFTIFGFSFKSIAIARILMILLFLLRILIEFQIVKKIFGRLTAFIFIPVFLLDTFTVMTVMQVRQDNLMMPLFSLGLLFFVHSRSVQARHSWGVLFISGLFLSLSVLILLKIAPAVILILIFFFSYSVIKKRLLPLFFFLAGLSLPPTIFILYIFSQGFLSQMIQQIIFDRLAFNTSLLWPTSIWYFYKPDNPMLYGFYGKPLTFIYSQLLPLMALMGIIAVRRFSFLKLLLIAILIVQIISILSIKGVFLQYFITLSSFLAIFAAVFLTEIIKLLHKRASIMPKIIFLGISLAFILVAVKANINRSAYNNKETENGIRKIWQTVPEGEKSFPNYLFRPLSYPLAMGAYLGDVPSNVLKRLGPIRDYLEKDKVKYLLLNDYDMQFVDPDTKNYIRQNYTLDPALAVWLRSRK